MTIGPAIARICSGTSGYSHSVQEESTLGMSFRRLLSSYPDVSCPSACMLLLDCAVCIQGFAATLSYRCSECSGETSVGPVVLAVFAVLVSFFVIYMISIEGDRNTSSSIGRMKEAIPLQSFKIIIVSWQIVTQVRVSDEARLVSTLLLFCRFSFSRPGTRGGSKF